MHLDLRNFPFDTQHLKLMFGATLWSADVVWLLDQTDRDIVASFQNRLSRLVEWKSVSPVTIEEKLMWNEEDKRDISYLSINFSVRRLSSYYVFNVFAAILFLDILFWWTFLVPPAQLNDRYEE